jgi:ribonuclease P protein component
LIWRIRERRSFGRLSAEGRRVRAGVLWCTFVLDPHGSETPPRVAFALGRALGPAVTRNLVRRRLRALLQSAESSGLLPPGEYLIGGQPAIAARSFDQLRTDVQSLLRQIPGSSG